MTVFLMVSNAATAGTACVPANCDDGDLCTEDHCILNECTHVVTVLCDDGNVCTTDTCNPLTGACV